MRRRTRGVLLLLTAVPMLLVGCVVLPPLPAEPTASDPTPTPAAPTTPAPTETSPVPSPTASAATLGPVLDAHGCSLAFIEAMAFAYDALSFREGFVHPELLEGYDVPCSGTQPSDTLPTVAVFSFAIVPAADGVLDELDARILATGLDPDPIVWGIYQDAAADPIAFLDPVTEWQEGNETFFDDAEDWVVLLW